LYAKFFFCTYCPLTQKIDNAQFKTDTIHGMGQIHLV
jgi:hypothetical protein